MRAFRPAAQHLLCQRGLRRRGLRPTVRALLTLLLPFLEPLQRFVDAHGQELHHRILHTQASFEFPYRRRFGRELHQDVAAFAILLNPVSQPPLSPLVDLVNRAAGCRDTFAHLVDQVVDLFFCRIGFYDEQILVDSHSSSVGTPPWARRLNFAMDFSTPSVIMDSVASAARSTNASSVSVCWRVNRDNR